MVAAEKYSDEVFGNADARGNQTQLLHSHPLESKT